MPTPPATSRQAGRAGLARVRPARHPSVNLALAVGPAPGAGAE